MDILLRTLKNIMASEISSYKKLLELSRIKSKVLIKNRTADLGEIVEKEQEILNGIKLQEKDRVECVSKISSAYGLGENNIDIETIIEEASGSEKDDIIRLRAEFKDVLLELADKNEQNKMLIETHRKYVEFCMQAIAGQLSSLSTYSHAGGESSLQTANVLFDSSI